MSDFLTHGAGTLDADSPLTGASLTGVSAVTFTGSGLDDATSGGAYTGTGTVRWQVEIDATGGTDSFKWRKDDGAYTTGVNCAITATELDEGVTVTFAAVTGHTLGDVWEFSSPKRDSVAEIMRERDAHLYERLTRAQVASDQSFYGDVDTTVIDDDAIDTYTEPGLNRGIQVNQLERTAEKITSGALTFPASGPFIADEEFFLYAVTDADSVWFAGYSVIEPDGGSTAQVGTSWTLKFESSAWNLYFSANATNGTSNEEITTFANLAAWKVS